MFKIIYSLWRAFYEVSFGMYSINIPEIPLEKSVLLECVFTCEVFRNRTCDFQIHQTDHCVTEKPKNAQQRKIKLVQKRFTDTSGRYEHSTQDRSGVVFDTKKTRESLIHEALHCYGVYVDDIEISRDNVHVCLCVVDVLNAGVIKVFSLSSGRRLSVLSASSSLHVKYFVCDVPPQSETVQYSLLDNY